MVAYMLVRYGHFIKKSTLFFFLKPLTLGQEGGGGGGGVIQLWYCIVQLLTCRWFIGVVWVHVWCVHNVHVTVHCASTCTTW